MYYNTTNISGQELEDRKEKTHTQDDYVLRLFQIAGCPLSASQVLDLLRIADHNRTWLITSVRRSINSLAQAGALERMAEKITGPWGGA